MKWLAPEATGALCRARRAHRWYHITATVSWCRDCGILRVGNPV